MIRLSNDNLGRILHFSLYERLRAFCAAHTPEVPAEAFVNAVLNRLYNGDTSLHVLVELEDSYTIVAHAVIDVQDAFGNKVVYCHQLQRDKPDTAKQDEFMEALQKLAEYHSAVCIAFSVTKNAKVYEKKYGYSLARSVMIKTLHSVDTDEGDSHG